MKTFFKLKEELSHISEAADKHMSRELELHSDNDEGAYKHRSAVQKNLSKKFKKGTYDHDKAKKLWQMHADRVAQSYHKQHMDSKTPWHKQINTATRKHAAATMADDWHSEMKAGNFHESVELDELSVDTLQSYRDKASKDKTKMHTWLRKNMFPSSKAGDSQYKIKKFDKLLKKNANRKQGLDRAFKKSVDKGAYPGRKPGEYGIQVADKKDKN